MKNFAIAQGGIKSDKGLLTHVLYGFSRLQSRAQFQLDQRAEVRAKMLLRTKISSQQTRDVGFVKGVELQVLASRTNGWRGV